ncbi:MAG: NAD+ synthase [Mariprofundaceae bacterium]
MKIMLAQCCPRVGDIEGNVNMITDIATQAEYGGCDLVIFPELAVTGYPPEDLLLRPAFMDAVGQAIISLKAASRHCCMVFGAPRREGDSLRNSAFLCQNGQALAIYDKKILPNYGVFDEKRYFEPGDSDSIFVVNGKRIGIGICEDLWDDQLAAQCASSTCDLWLNLNASPFHIGKQVEREALTSRRAKMLASPIAYINPVGGQDEVVFDGGSHVMNAKGQLMMRAPLFETKTNIVALKSANRDIVETTDDIAQIYQALTIGVRDYVQQNGCQQVVIGLSGGIDSALSATIAVDALGADNVLGVLLPSKYSSDHSLTDARDLVVNLGIESIILPISQGVETVESILEVPFANWSLAEADVTEENIQARMRGLLLMAISNKTGRMLLTTGNKSEMAVGYATLYGDMAGGFAVLKDLYKTQAFALARYINRDKERIPKNTLDKPPSAELRPDQKDSDSLPEYEVLDAILSALIEEKEGIANIISRGFDADEVHQIMKLLHLSEYKRRQAPPGVKITERAFGRDRRYPITHHFRQ